MARQSIASLANEPHTEVNGIFRACSPMNRTAKNKSPYTFIRLVDATGQINGYAWPNTYKGRYHPEDNDIIHIVGKTKICPTNGSVVIDIRNAEPIPQIEENPLQLLPLQLGADSSDLQQLMELVDGLTSPSLKKFLFQAFSDDSLTFPFVSGPSSQSWHHTEQGGNLRHSLECAKFVAMDRDFSQYEREIGIVGALFHDLGKIRMHYNSRRYSPPTSHHDTLTLELLAKPLHILDNEWPDGASMLRQIWTYPLTKYNSIKTKHIPSLVTLVWFADTYSAAKYKEKVAFSASPAWKQYASFQKITYWRPFSDNNMENAA